MDLGSFLVASGKGSLTIQDTIQLIHCVATMRVKNTAGYEPDVYALDRCGTIMREVKEAINGKISITYQDERNGVNQTLVNNRPLIDIAEIHAGVDNTGIVAKCDSSDEAEGAVHYQVYKVWFKLILSLDGSIVLGGDKKIRIDFSDFTNQSFVTTAGSTFYNTKIEMFGDVASRDSKRLFVTDSQTVKADDQVGFDLMQYDRMAFPLDIERLLLHGLGTTPFELKDELVEPYITNTTRDHIFVDGFRSRAYQWAVIPTPINSRGTVELTSDGRIYLMRGYDVV